MNKKQLAILGGICTIVAAATAAERNRKWEDIHKIAVVAGAAVTILGVLG